MGKSAVEAYIPSKTNIIITSIHVNNQIMQMMMIIIYFKKERTRFAVHISDDSYDLFVLKFSCGILCLRCPTGLCVLACEVGEPKVA